MSFGAKRFRSKRQQSEYDKTFIGRYQKLVKKNSFLYLGLPMMLSVALGSVLLSNFTAIRYEKRDQQIKELDESEALSFATKTKRKVDMKEEYYKLQGLMDEHADWEPKRVERLKGESENVW